MINNNNTKIREKKGKEKEHEIKARQTTQKSQNLL